MIDKKKLSQIKAEVAALLGELPATLPPVWLAKEIESARRDPNRDAENLEMLCAALRSEASRRQRPKSRREPVKR